MTDFDFHTEREQADLDDPLSTPQFVLLTQLLEFATETRSRLGKELAPYGVSWAGFEVLEQITRSGPMGVGAISRRLGRHRTSVLAALARLEDAGLICRAGISGNRNEHLHTVTERGRNVHRRASRALLLRRHELLQPRDIEAIGGAVAELQLSERPDVADRPTLHAGCSS